jgi:hypothetical protein
MTAQPLVLIGTNYYTFDKLATGKQAIAAYRLMARLSKSNTLVTVAVSLKG